MVYLLHMDVKHFFKMLLWLVFMAGIGIGGLVLANHYSKAGTSAPLTSSR